MDCGNGENHQEKGAQGYIFLQFSYLLVISHIIFFQVVIATEIESLVESLFMEEDASEQTGSCQLTILATFVLATVQKNNNKKRFSLSKERFSQ